MAHSVSSIFQKTTEKLLNSFSNTFFIQLHGFAKLVTDPYVILSNGTQITPGLDYIVPLTNNLLIEDNTLTFKIAHIDLEWTRLRAFDNTQGRLINSSIDPCYSYATTTNGRFLSIEQERTKLRDDVTGWNKMANALINTFVCYPFLWDGSSDSDWNTAANWRGNAVPASSDNVTIANRTNNPAINEEPGSPAICNHLEIQPEASLTINPGKALTVSGTLNNFGTLNIKSDETGTGSLINSTIGVEANVERFLTKMKWHFIGMPLTSEVAGVFDLPPGHADIYLKTHIESTNTWGPYIVPIETPLTQGRGYECWVGNPAVPANQMDETVVFTGKLGAGDYSTGYNNFYTLEYTSGHGLNLICNPYPSALQANIGSWDKNNVASSVWTWSDALGNYVYWGSGNNYGGGSFGTLTSGIIPAMQAFFVEAIGSSPVLTIPQSDRIHSDQSYYKDTEVLPNTIRLDVKGNGYQDAIFVCINDQATVGFDVNYDVRKIFGLYEAPQLYSVINDEILSINALPKTDDYISLQLGFECAVPEVFTIEASGTDSFESGIDIYLEDLKEDLIQNLSLNPFYSFDHIPAYDPNRFVLHFEPPNGIDEQGQYNFIIYVKGNQVYIVNPYAAEVNFVIHDITGREILNGQLIPSCENKILLNLSTGWYIVTLINNSFVVSEKVFIQ
jgi:hypothetical protein